MSHESSAMADFVGDASFSFEEALRCIASRLPDELIGVEAVERLALCASVLPAGAGQSMFGFEMRLDDTAPLCDFFLDVPPNSPAGADLVESGRSSAARASDRSLGRVLQELQSRDNFLSRWFRRVILEYDLIDGAESGRSSAARASDRSLGRVLQELQSRDNFLSRWFRRVILEYDLIDGAESGRLHPGLFLTPAFGDGEDVLDDDSPYQIANPGVLVAALCAAVNWQEEREEVRTVFGIVDALPAVARLTHIGALPIRTPRALRFLLRMPPDEVTGYLDRIGWQGSRAAVAQVLSLAFPGFDRLAVGLDITGRTVSPRIGVELHFHRPWWHIKPGDYREFVDRFVTQGWCTPRKAAGLERWMRREHLVWKHGHFQFVSGLSHFKLVIDGRKVSLKGYAGAKFLF